MRERGVSTVGGIVLAAGLGALVAVAMMDWVVVEVRVADPQPFHVTVPFPLIVGHLACSLIPNREGEAPVVPPEVRARREVALAAVRSLVEAPDATLVKVEADDARVEASKRGDVLLVAVDAEDARVRCAVPLAGVLAALEEWDWERFDAGVALDILSAADHGELVTVEADGVRVEVTIS